MLHGPHVKDQLETILKEMKLDPLTILLTFSNQTNGQLKKSKNMSIMSVSTSKARLMQLPLQDLSGKVAHPLAGKSMKQNQLQP